MVRRPVLVLILTAAATIGAAAPAAPPNLDAWVTRAMQTFEVPGLSLLRADAFVAFASKPDGSIDRIRMTSVSPSTDFSFDFQDLLLKPVASDPPRP
ncbi:MAG TPA: hypothetical protein VF219_13060 [Vicinamibacterales bacterium]